MSDTIVTVVGLMFILFFGIFLINQVEVAITGSAVAGCNVQCNSNIDCDDNNANTEDVCMYPKSCESICYHSLR